MSDNITRRLDAWTAADRAAHAAARQLLARRLAHIQRNGSAPTEDEVRAVAALKAEAARLYRHAMDELDEVAAQAAAVPGRRPA